MAERIGVAILAYYALGDLKTAVRSVQEHTQLDYHLMVFDNSEDAEVREWMMHHCPSAEYVRSGYNVGCAVARNRIAERMARQSIRHFVVMDQDVEVVEDAWAARMLAVFARYPDSGIVGWELANRTMGPRHNRDKTGRVPELPGMCNMYSMECVAAADGWCPDYFFYKFDTDFCGCAGLKGFWTRVVNPDGTHDGVRHNHPHRGTKRHPNAATIKRQSQELFKRRHAELGFATLGI
jgi:GT2 family glycosyltransferase